MEPGDIREARTAFRLQLDHVLIPRDDLSRVRDASIFDQGTVESDHASLQIKLRVARNLSKQNVSNF
jgi:endonuclease/exonuclease/phosphatase family metal-dependent hydrolase